ncbi:MAG: nuclear transport factor 2 family protein [Betaproteobacteria bacterium]|nr:nuclear transport factor 2 family protein [Betaproteobacteria bacterium]
MSSALAFKAEAMRVLAAEDEYVAAEVGRDEATLRRLVDDRFLFNTSRGTTTGKEGADPRGDEDEHGGPDHPGTVGAG